MVYFYEPSIYTEFQRATEPVYNYRTANLTSSISTRIEGFEAMLQMNTKKMANVTKEVFGGEAPYKSQGVNSSHCTVGVNADYQAKANVLEPLWETSFRLQMGSRHDISPYRVVLMVDNAGACAWSRDPESDPVVSGIHEMSDFYHEVFDDFAGSFERRRRLQPDGGIFIDDPVTSPTANGGSNSTSNQTTDD